MNKIVVLSAMLLMQACAFTDSALKVEHDTAVNITGPISDGWGYRLCGPATG